MRLTDREIVVIQVGLALAAQEARNQASVCLHSDELETYRAQAAEADALRLRLEEELVKRRQGQLGRWARRAEHRDRGNTLR